MQLLLKESIDDSFPGMYWVSAEISSLSTRASGHCYMDLVQTDGSGRVEASAKAVVWSSRWWSLSGFFLSETGNALQPGLSVLVQVKVNYSPVYGLSLIINDIDPQYTLGGQEALKRHTLARLEEEGRLQMQKELCVPALSRHLAIISSPDAAGYGDFVKHLGDNSRGFTFASDLYPALMQGTMCPGAVAEALNSIAESGKAYDAVLLIRGGGSNLDLSCYDSYEMCSAIADCPIPVLSAVGHDRDYHVCDMVACRYYKTPTALADALVESLVAEDDRILLQAQRLRRAFASKIALMESALARIGEKICSSDPRNIVSRGYVLTLDSSGRVVRSASALESGDSMSLMYGDGIVHCTVDSVEITRREDNPQQKD